MIKYRLVCKNCETTFDSWFASSKEYERLKKKDFLNCHICNSFDVEKTLMSPNVFSSKNDSKNAHQIKKYKQTKEIILKKPLCHQMYLYQKIALRLIKKLKNTKKQRC